MRLSSLVFGLSLALAGTASAQVSGPSSGGPTPPQGNLYTPIYGVTGGITIPVGRLSDDHAAGYTVGGLVEYSVLGQPYSLRGELLYQRFPLKSGRTTGTDVGLTSLGATFVYKLAPTPSSTFVSGGIAIYHGTDLGTRPGFNAGAGVEIPLTGFSATGETRLHVMLADGKPIVTLPISVGIRF
jgi:hypothetical protein